MIKNISNLGDAALYCDFGNEINKNINSEVIKFFKTIKEKNIEGITNLTPSYNKLIVSYDLRVTNFKEIKDKIENLEINEVQEIASKKLEIPVCCDSSFSLDMRRLEKKLNLSREKILENFFNKEYFCYMIGFIAGMPFLGDLGEKSKHHSNKYDPDLLEIVNSANVACGFHAGDDESMSQVIEISKKNNVSIGAHPSFNDPENFGRKRMDLSSIKIRKLIIDQYEILQKIANEEERSWR